MILQVEDMSRKVMKEMADQMAAIGEDKPVNDITMNVRLMFFFDSRGKMPFHETIGEFLLQHSIKEPNSRKRTLAMGEIRIFKDLPVFISNYKRFIFQLRKPAKRPAGDDAEVAETEAKKAKEAGKQEEEKEGHVSPAAEN